MKVEEKETVWSSFIDAVYPFLIYMKPFFITQTNRSPVLLMFFMSQFGLMNNVSKLGDLVGEVNLQVDTSCQWK